MLYVPRSHTPMGAHRVMQFTLAAMQDDAQHMVMVNYKEGIAMANVAKWIKHTE